MADWADDVPRRPLNRDPAPTYDVGDWVRNQDGDLGHVVALKRGAWRDSTQLPDGRGGYEYVVCFAMGAYFAPDARPRERAKIASQTTAFGAELTRESNTAAPRRCPYCHG